MRLKIAKRNIIFSITYFISIMILLLNQIDALPMAETLRKVKYVYVFVIAFLVLISGRIKKGSFLPLLVFGLYLLHDIIFGYVYVNNLVTTQVQDNARQMLWFLLFVGVTFAYVAQHNCFKLFVVLSYYATGLQLIIGGLQHRDNFVNPVWGLIQSFTADVRFKNTFGFVHAGYTSNACFLVIVLSVFFFEIYRETPEFRKPWFWISFLVIDGVAGLELTAAAERSGIICSFGVVAWYLFWVFFNLRFERKTLWILIAVVSLAIAVFAGSGGLAKIWGDSNRELNISVNYPLFKAYANQWLGLGFIENAGFQSDNNLYPMKTSSLDMYYVYIFFATGLLGTIIIGLALVLILVKLLINRKTNLNIIGIGFYLIMLFFAVWQCNLFTHRYISSYVISVILLCSMCNDFCMGNSGKNDELIA